MLYTEAHIARANQAYHVQPERLRKVKKSMAAIRTVLGERKREKIAQFALKQIEKEEETKGIGEEYVPDEETTK